MNSSVANDRRASGGRRNDLQLSAGIGVALFPENGKSVDKLPHYADSAMHSAKKRGRGQVCSLSADLTQATWTFQMPIREMNSEMITSLSSMRSQAGCCYGGAAGVEKS